MRLTVEDDATGVRSDVHVDCAPSDRIGDVLAMVSAVLPVRGTPVVDGAPLPLDHAVAGSPLREGSVLHYGRRPQLSPVRSAPPLVLRVVSGVAAGTELPLVPGQVVIVGRAASCQLVLDDPDVSRQHAQLVVGRNRVTLADLGSRNGVQLDGRTVAGAADVDGKVIQIGGNRLVVEAFRDRAAVVGRGDSGEVLLNRTPRSRPVRFDPPTVAMPARPVDDDDRGFPVLPALLPLVAAVVMALVLRNAIFLLFGLLSPLMLIGSWWTERRRRQRRGLRNEESYRSKLTAAMLRIEAATDDEDADLRAGWPDPATTVRTAIAPRRELWERQPADDDWLAIRLGRADRPATVKITGEPPDGWSPPMLRLAPLGVSLVDQPMLGIAGPPGWLDAQLAWVVTQLAVHHSPDELRLVVIAPDAGEEQLGWLRWLPHLRAADGSVRAGWDPAGAEHTIKFLGDELQRRSAGGARDPSPARQARPDLVVVLAGTADLRRRPQLTNLLNRGPAAGLRFVCAEADERARSAERRCSSSPRNLIIRSAPTASHAARTEPSSALRCGSQRSQPSCSSPASGAMTASRSSSGLWCTASWVTTQASWASSQAGGPARPSMGWSTRLTPSGANRKVGGDQPSGGSPVICTAAGRSARPNRTASQSSSAGCRSHNSRLGVIAVRTVVAGSGQAARRSASSSSVAASIRARAAVSFDRYVCSSRCPRRCRLRRSVHQFPISMSGLSRPNRRKIGFRSTRANTTAATSGSSAGSTGKPRSSSSLGRAGMATVGGWKRTGRDLGVRLRRISPESARRTTAARSCSASTTRRLPPIWMTFPSTSAAPATACPSSSTPLREPRSASVTCRGPTTSWACRRETSGSSSTS